MPTIELETEIAAPVERVFDLARSIGFHMHSASVTRERAVAGVTSGLIESGQEVTWRARHFGLWQMLTVRITSFDRPRHFRDEMVSGIFRRMEHDHYFEPIKDGVRMRDVFLFESPMGVFGRIADLLVLKRYLRAFLTTRNSSIKAVAESELWRTFLPAA